MERRAKKMTPKKFLRCLSVLQVIVLLLVFTPAANSADPAASFPSKPIEYVTHSAPGGPQNLIGHLIVEIVQQEKILPQPMVFKLVPGSGMAKAFSYLFERKGDAHILAGLPSFLAMATPLRVKVPYTYKDFTPIANVCTDGSVLVVSTKSKYKNMEDLIAEARKRPNQLSQGGSSITSNEAWMGKTMQKIKGVQWKFVSFKAEMEAASNVLGGNVDFAFLNATSVIEHVRAGNLKVILAGTKERYKAFPDAPTILEAGLGEPDMTYRGFIGPPNMPSYAVKTLEAAAKKILKSPRFQKHLEMSMMQEEWMDTREYAKFLDKDFESVKKKLTEAGMLK
jgi:putative tricarboxylic transport membrane protein